MSVALIREHLAGAGNAAARPALVWFFHEARREGAEREWAAAVEKGAGTGRLAAGSGQLASELTEGATAVAAVGKPPVRGGGRDISGIAGAGTHPPTADEVVGPRRSGVPAAAATDVGGADWERALIAASRARGFLWRTEETYRMWGAQFAEFLRPRPPEAAGAEEVAAFLSALAVERRASPSAQKQAA